MNRVLVAYDRMEAQIAQRVADGSTTADKVEETRVALDMDGQEHSRFQTLKSLACANQTLTTDEGMTIYLSLGESLDTFNGQPAHVKAVLTKIWHEMLTKEINGWL
jgi:hypothetical protein